MRSSPPGTQNVQRGVPLPAWKYSLQPLFSCNPAANQGPAGRPAAAAGPEPRDGRSVPARGGVLPLLPACVPSRVRRRLPRGEPPRPLLARPLRGPLQRGRAGKRRAPPGPRQPRGLRLSPSRPVPSVCPGPGGGEGSAGGSHVSRGTSDPHRGEQRGARGPTGRHRRLLRGLRRGAHGRRLFPLLRRHAEGGPDGKGRAGRGRPLGTVGTLGPGGCRSHPCRVFVVAAGLESGVGGCWGRSSVSLRPPMLLLSSRRSREEGEVAAPLAR